VGLGGALSTTNSSLSLSGGDSRWSALVHQSFPLVLSMGGADDASFSGTEDSAGSQEAREAHSLGSLFGLFAWTGRGSCG
jgi:hypothetical protein